jgi:NusA-like KH domain protein
MGDPEEAGPGTEEEGAAPGGEAARQRRERKDKEKVFTENTLALVALFEGATDVKVRDCIEFASRVVFIVPNGRLNHALGRNASNVKRLREIFRKRVHIVEWFDDPARFCVSVFRDYGAFKVEFEDRGKVHHATVWVRPEKKATAIGKEGHNLSDCRDIIARHTEITSVSVSAPGDETPGKPPTPDVSAGGAQR